MKTKRLFTLLAALTIALVSFACSLFSQGETATPTPDYIFEPVTTPLKIEPDSLPDARTGAEYVVEIRVSDNVTPVSNVSVSDGALPAGLELAFASQDDGITIIGIPEETGTFTFTVFVSCFGTMVSGQTGQREYTLTVE